MSFKMSMSSWARERSRSWVRASQLRWKKVKASMRSLTRSRISRPLPATLKATKFLAGLHLGSSSALSTQSLVHHKLASLYLTACRFRAWSKSWRKKSSLGSSSKRNLTILEDFSQRSTPSSQQWARLQSKSLNLSTGRHQPPECLPNDQPLLNGVDVTV